MPTRGVSDIQAAKYHQGHPEVKIHPLIRVAHAIYLIAMTGSRGIISLN